MKAALLAVIVTAFVLSASCPGATLLVPSQYPTIQSGIDAAVDGDTVIVAPGRYTGEGNRDISFKGKAITVQSEDPNDPNVVAATIIDCNGAPYPGSRGFIFETNETAESVLSGLTITNGTLNGGAIYCGSASPTISRCVLSNNSAEYGGGIACRDSNAIISDCIITGNFVSGCGSGGGGIWCIDSNVRVERSDITHNISMDRGGDAIWSRSSVCRISDCVISGRTDLRGTVLEFRWSSEGYIAGCTIISQAEEAIYVEDSNCVIDDCTIVHGRYGVLSSRDSDVIVTGCTISPSSDSAVNGVYADISGNLSISDSNISGHSAEGVWFEGNDLSVRNSTIANNGGGIMAFSGRRAELTGSTIVANSPLGGATLWTNSTLVAGCIIKDNCRDNSDIYDGGGLTLRGQFKIDRCLIVNNTSSRRGGGAYVTGIGEITDSEIAGNVSACNGGGIYAWGNVLISQCSIRNNVVTGSSIDSEGGGIYVGGTGIIEHSYISGNSANIGGGAYINGSVRNSVVVGNRATEWGGGMVCGAEYRGARGTLVNSTISANRAGQSDGAGIIAARVDFNDCVVWGNDGPDLLPGQQIYPGYSVEVRYSCVQGGFAGEGNIDAEPRFVMPGYWDANGTLDDANEDFWVDGDYRLRWDSPCIDAGEPNYVGDTNETDIDGNPRVFDGDEDGVARVDMGAYEYIPPIEARVCIMPNVLNLKSNGRWIICTIRLPQPYDVEEIDSNSVLLEEQIPAERVLIAQRLQTAFALFDRQAVEAILQPGKAELLITGQLNNGREFEGSDTIRVISGPLTLFRAHRHSCEGRNPFHL